MKAYEVSVAGAGYNIDEMTASPQPPFHVTAAAACVHVLLTLLCIARLIISCTRSMQAFYLTLNLTQFAYMRFAMSYRLAESNLQAICRDILTLYETEGRRLVADAVSAGLLVRHAKLTFYHAPVSCANKPSISLQL
jgi:hypothetical protein